MQDILVLQLLWLLFMYFGCGTFSQTIPRLLNAYVTDSDEFTSNELCVNRSLTTVFFIYMLYLKTI